VQVWWILRRGGSVGVASEYLKIFASLFEHVKVFVPTHASLTPRAGIQCPGVREMPVSLKLKRMLVEHAENDEADELYELLELIRSEEEGADFCVDGWRDGRGYSALLAAVTAGAEDCVKLLLEQKASPKQRTQHARTSALTIAAREGHTSVCVLLLDAKCDADGGVGKQTAVATPLTRALLRGHAETALILLARGADASHCTTGRAMADYSSITPLCCAIRGPGCGYVVDALLERGAVIDEREGRWFRETLVWHTHTHTALDNDNKHTGLRDGDFYHTPGGYTVNDTRPGPPPPLPRHADAYTDVYADAGGVLWGLDVAGSFPTAEDPGDAGEVVVRLQTWFVLVSCGMHFQENRPNHPSNAAYAKAHAFINEYHALLKDTLSLHVEVDTRVGLTQNGIYQEPLERVLEYCGLHMNARPVTLPWLPVDGGEAPMPRTQALIHARNSHRSSRMYAALLHARAKSSAEQLHGIQGPTTRRTRSSRRRGQEG
jgi:hypothetical protein